MGRSPCCSKEGLNRGAWTAMEDKILTAYIKSHGEGKWRNLPKRAGLKRCGKSCRLRWLNYLRPDIKRGNISHDEEELIVRLHRLLGNRWSLIAGRLPGRTDNEIKNYWNTTLGKKANAQSNSAQPNPNPDQTPPFKRKLTNFRPNNKPSNSKNPTQVIHTKATRCNKVFITSSLSPEIHTPTNATVQNQPPENQDFEYSAELMQYCTGTNEEILQNYDKNGTDQLQGSENYGYDRGSHFPSVPDLDLFKEEWASATVCLDEDEDDDNVNLDLDSLAFLLDSEEWPSL